MGASRTVSLHLVDCFECSRLGTTVSSEQSTFATYTALFVNLAGDATRRRMRRNVGRQHECSRARVYYSNGTLQNQLLSHSESSPNAQRREFTAPAFEEGLKAEMTETRLWLPWKQDFSSRQERNLWDFSSSRVQFIPRPTRLDDSRTVDGATSSHWHIERGIEKEL